MLLQLVSAHLPAAWTLENLLQVTSPSQITTQALDVGSQLRTSATASNSTAKDSGVWAKVQLPAAETGLQ